MTAVQIGSSTDASTLKGGHQKKLVRDSSGYYYACWFDQNDEIFLIKSANITGFTGAETPVEIIGSTGVGLVDNGDYPDIVIDDNDILHMVFRRRVESECWYVQWNTSTAMNNANNWKHADGSTNGAERLCTDNFGNVGAPTTNIDSNNYPHAVWNQDDGGIHEIFYRRWTGAAWSAADTQITDGSAQNSQNASIAIDGNDHAHVCWRYDEADRNIRYGHSHDFTNWFQSDDVSAITTGASGEELITEVGKDMDRPSVAISKHAGTLNDISVVAEEATDDDIMAAYYDRSAGTWTKNIGIEGAGVCLEPTVGFDSDGNVYRLYEKDGNIRLSSSFGKATLEDTGATLVQAQIEKNFTAKDVFGYLFFDSTNGKIYFSIRYAGALKKNPLIEQNQNIKRCHSDIGYFFKDAGAYKGYWDKLSVPALDPPKVNPLIEQKGTGNKIGYVFTQTCNQTENFDKLILSIPRIISIF